MSSLEDLVADALSLKDCETETPLDLSPLQALEARVSLEDLLAACQSLRLAGSEEITYRLAQVLAYLERSPLYPRLRSQLSSSARAVALLVENKRDELDAWIEEVEVSVATQKYLQEEKIVLHNVTAQIDFLSDFFKEDLQGELSEIVSVQPATAKRWIEGGSPSWDRRRQIELLARTFYTLRHKSNMSNQQALAWYRSGAPSPRDLLQAYDGFIISKKLLGVLRTIGFQSLD